MTDPKVKVLGRYVLVEQIMKKKDSRIILDTAGSEQDKFDYSFKVIQKGDKCESEIKVGEHPIFEKHVQFQGVKAIEKTDLGMISILIVHEESIVGIDYDGLNLSIQPPEESLASKN
jgi:hypothetical protein